MITLQSNKKETAISKFFQVDIISLKDFVTKHLVLMIFYNGAISSGWSIIFREKVVTLHKTLWQGDLTTSHENYNHK